MPTVINYATLPMNGARKASDYVSSRTAVTTSEQISVPAGATHVLMSGNLPFYVAFGDNPTASVATDADDGSACELINPATPQASRMFILSGVAKIAVAADAAAKVTASFYKH